mgnify:CR=1 FL=1
MDDFRRIRAFGQTGQVRLYDMSGQFIALYAWEDMGKSLGIVKMFFRKKKLEDKEGIICSISKGCRNMKVTENQQ